MKDIDLDNRDDFYWNDSKDSTVLNNFVKTLMNFEVIPRDFREYVEGTYFERRWNAEVEKRRSSKSRTEILGSQ